jgi:glycosyl transferase family 25
MSEPVSRLPIVFINLASDIQRRSKLEAEFVRMGLMARRLDAVRWAELSDNEQSDHYSASLNDRHFHTPLVAGEKGCYASHLVAWRELMDSSHTAMVVLEDDVRFDPQLPAVLAAIEAMDVPWDMIKLIGRAHEKIRSRRHLSDGVDLIEYARVPSMTAGYVVSRRGAEKLLATRKPFGRPIDVDLRFWWENDLVILGVTPSVLALEETSFVSSIGQKGQTVNWLSRWKKFVIKARLTLGNTWANGRRGRLLD